MGSFIERYRLRNSVKEALDNLPSGVCFFNSDGILVLCNRQMYRLAFLLMGHDLQTLAELKDALEIESETDRDGMTYQLSDGSWWNFFVREVTDSGGRLFTEATAFDVSDLHEKQELLKVANEAKAQTLETLQHIQDNIVDIAREEEILAMKMQLHNKFGYTLQTIRRFYLHGCPSEEKEEFLAGQRDALGMLRGELDVAEEIDSFGELERLAETLDMKITVTGELPRHAETKDILAEVMRECMTNAIRHAGGDQVFLELSYGEERLRALVTNNGDPPAGEIRESGGLISIRKRVEGFGGAMSVRSLPRFQLEIELPVKEGKYDDSVDRGR